MLSTCHYRATDTLGDLRLLLEKYSDYALAEEGRYIGPCRSFPYAMSAAPLDPVCEPDISDLAALSRESIIFLCRLCSPEVPLITFGDKVITAGDQR